MCLAMVLAGCGKIDDQDALRKRFRVSSRGARLSDILRVANEFGLQAQAYRAPISDLAQLGAPLIAHLRQNHFVVLSEVSRRAVVFHDPTFGRRALPLPEFEKLYGGVVMSFSAPTPTPRQTDLVQAAPLPRRALMRPLPGPAVLLGVLDIIPAILALAASLFIDATIAGGGQGGAPGAAIGLVALGVVGHIVCRAYANGVARRSSLGVATQIWSGDISKRLVQGHRSQIEWLSEIGNASFEILKERIEIVGRLCVASCAVIALLMIDWRSAMIALPVAIALSGAASLLSRRNDRRPQIDNITLRFKKAIARSGASGPRWWGSFWREVGDEVAWVSTWRSLFAAGLRTELTDSTTSALVTVATIGVIHALSFLEPVRHPAALVAATGILGFCTRRLWVLLPNLPKRARQLQRLRHVLAEPSSTPEVADLAVRGAVSIEIADLAFSYGVGEAKIFDGLTLKIAAGEHVTVRGAPSSGKSTLLKLMIGSESPQRGDISWRDEGGVRIEASTADGLFGYVSQENELFAGTLFQNIAGFARDPDLTRAIDCARVARLDEFVRSVPMRYEAFVVPGGANLSASERTKVMIARALYEGYGALLIDDVMGRLDAADRNAILLALKERRITTVLVAGSDQLAMGEDHELIVGQPVGEASRKPARALQS